LRIAGSYNDTVNVSLILSKQGIKVIAGILEGIINTEFEDGLSINALIDKTPLGFFNLTELELTVFDHYASIALTPQFDRLRPKAMRNLVENVLIPNASVSSGMPAAESLLQAVDLLEDSEKEILQQEFELIKLTTMQSFSKFSGGGSQSDEPEEFIE
jgi:hypothetical protein